MSSQRLEEIRAAIRAENISYGEIAELQDMRDEIDPGDVELLEWAGVPEFGVVGEFEGPELSIMIEIECSRTGEWVLNEGYVSHGRTGSSATAVAAEQLRYWADKLESGDL